MELHEPVSQQLGPIDTSLAYLATRSWWLPFRAGRRDVPLIDDALCIGHFCRWLEEQLIVIQDVTTSHLDAYLVALAPLRPALRPAYEARAKALLSFFAESTT
jgi:hypothetical protein